MSDVTDAVAEALRLNRRLAATLLVKKQELEAELAAGPEADRAEVLTAELARVDAEYRAALAEVDELRGLGDRARADADNAVVDDALASDPLLPTYEERALAAAREHIRELEAQTSLTEPPAERIEPRAAPKTREQSDEDARAEFEALRAKHAAEPPEAPKEPRPRPKKTM